MKSKLFHVSDCDLAEGPVWYDNCLWWVDIESGRLLNLKGEVFNLPFSVGAALPCVSKQWLLAEEKGFSFWNLNGKTHRFWSRTDPSPKYRFNDAKVAPDGSVWAGTLKRDTLDANCTFYRLKKNMDVKVEIQNIGLCNGLDWFDDKFYYTDTGKRTIFVRKGKNVKKFISIKHGYPDGLTVDTNGNVWSAIWGEGKVVCLDANTGKVIDFIEIPAPHVTACCFGGEDFETMFITTARQGLNNEQLTTFPYSGSIFSYTPGVKGFKTRIFNDGEKNENNRSKSMVS